MGSLAIGCEFTGRAFYIVVVSGGGSSVRVLVANASFGTIKRLKGNIPVSLNPYFMFD